MSPSRRQLLVATGVLTVTGVGMGGMLLPPFAEPAQAASSDVNQAELAKPAPEGDIVLGAAKAPVTIIEYASATCPHCAHFSKTTFPKLKKRYIDTGKVRFIFREFPLDALAAAGFMVARCVAKDAASRKYNGPKYMAVVETLFATQDQWVETKKPVPALEKIAKQFGLTEQSFDTCLKNQKLLDGIQAVRDRAAKKLGVDATPTFFINGKKLVGDVPIAAMAKVIDSYLKAG